MSDSSHIHIRNAREHNLRGVDLTIPRDALVVFTGVSGSGKSSIAFDTLHQEGQRRFVESLSSYARQFLGQAERPKVDAVEGISPTVCIDQKTVNRNPRSTVGTVTEVTDHLRLLYARLGIPHCPRCGTVIAKVGVDQVVDDVLARGRGKKLLVLGPVVRERKGEYREELAGLIRDGWLRGRIDGAVMLFEEAPVLARYEKHTIEVVIDRLVPDVADRARLAEAVEGASKLGGGIVHVSIEGEDGPEEHAYSTQRACPKHPDVAIPELEPRTFSFNAPQGACPACQGLGAHEGFVVDKVVDVDRTVPDAFQAWNDEGRVPFTHFDKKSLIDLCGRFNAPLKKPVRDWPEALRHKLLFGDPSLMYKMDIERDGRVEVRERPWTGLMGMVENVWKWTQWPSLQRFRLSRPCEDCGGTRLNEVARAVTFRDRPIHDLLHLSIREGRAFFDAVKLAPRETLIGEGIVAEVRDRLGFLCDVGLDYLGLDRSAATLSGGEAQRIRLAAQVGSALQGVTYVLDEPSIGLHPRDNARLLTTLRRLRDRGNSVIVVEHDAETILAADWVVELGPGAGVNGGHVTASSPVAEFLRSNALTAEWLRGERFIEPRKKRRKAKGKLVLRGADENNLKGIDVAFPLGCLVAVTGVSGSGKSTLVFDVLDRAVGRLLSLPVADRKGARIEGCKKVEGIDALDAIITIDQSPIGRTPRSNPATYTGAMDVIRDLFAATEESRARGYKKGRFSFNVPGGRCEACEGAGVKVVEMQFLPDVDVPCDTCSGRRFNAETLEVLYKGLSIRGVLDLSIGEAAAFFAPVPKLKRIFDTLVSVGLEYVTLGQAATTLSGGEAQRLKLSTELHRPATGKTLYLLDEPTTGLHFEDVKKLLDALHRLVDAGNSVIVVEHHHDVIRQADAVIDLGPEGGDGGGRLVGEGTPEQIAKMDTPTGRALRTETDLLAAEAAVHYVPVDHTPHAIVVRGARQNNLQAIDVDIQHNSFTVVTGPSGSGKTSLAFDTIFAEGQRRYVESLSTYARRFLGRMERPLVDKLEGLAPAIAIDQRNTSHNPRSTVATVTEIHDVLRVLYARVGQAHCPVCDRPLRGFSPSEAAQHIRRSGAGAGWLCAVLAPALAADERRRTLLAAGFVRILPLRGTSEISLEDDEANDVIAAGARLVVDRFDAAKGAASRISEAVTTAQRLGLGTAWFVPKSGEPIALATTPTCQDHGSKLPDEVTPRHFSFNARLGACDRCEGLGHVRAIVLDRVITNPKAPLLSAIDIRLTPLFTRSARTRATLATVMAKYGHDVDKTPYAALTASQRKVVMYGLPGPIEVKWTKEWGRTKQTVTEQLPWPGVIGTIDSVKEKLDFLVAETTCPECDGGRLRPELQAIRIGTFGIHALCALPITAARVEVATWSFSGENAAIAERPLAELVKRLKFLDDVGLGYLALDRAADTLSGGESQRIRLASQLGTGLVGVTYVLDEPTIGLHPRDTDRLLDTLFGLRDLGNTVLVVEHDPETIRRADYVIDLGPAAGRYGGKLVASGTPAEIAANPESGTGAWLSGRTRIPPRTTRRPARAEIVVKSPTAHNLRCGDVVFPTGVWVAVTGVSGSGKSTLALDTFAAAVRKELGELVFPEANGGVTFGEKVDRVVMVDQAPIGRTPRSTPATYVGLMDPLRALFAETPGARERGWLPGRFSFNAAGGRCEVCEGRGATLVEMHFLPDVWVTCDGCLGRRYSRETLAVRFKDRSIADVLAMRSDEALELFASVRTVVRPLQALVDVGLGYLTLGQPGNTLSGGESQRIKLAAELKPQALARPGVKKTGLYVLDEPTTGLHLSDVAKLVEVLHRIVDQGHTVVTIEHHLDMIAQADHVIELGPEGGAGGGLVLAVGTPEQIAASATATGEALRRSGLVGKSSRKKR